MTRDFNIIEKREHLESLIALLDLPRFHLDEVDSLKPQDIGNIAVEKAKIEFYQEMSLD